MPRRGNNNSAWDCVAFDDAILHKRVNVGKLKQKEYMQSGVFPIVDQGQALIAGYSDDQDYIYIGELPVIVFGDHTRVFKFVDFPFICGADGTKVLVPNTEEFDPAFLYFALLHIRLPSRGYNRHYSLLREQNVPHPPKHLQEQIASILLTIQRAKEATEEVIAAINELKKSLMKHLFKYGPVPIAEAEHVPFRETEIGPIPEHWHIISFRDSIRKKRFNVGKIKQSDYQMVGEFPIIDQGQSLVAGYWDVDDDVFDGELPVIVFGDHTRVIKFIDFDFVCGADGTKVLLPDKDKYDPLFLYYYLSSLNIPNRGYNRHYSVLKEQKLLLPPRDKQEVIAKILRSVDRKIEIEEKRKKAINELFKCILQMLMTGEVRLEGMER